MVRSFDQENSQDHEKKNEFQAGVAGLRDVGVWVA